MAHWKTRVLALPASTTLRSSLQTTDPFLVYVVLHICPCPCANACSYRLEVNIGHLPYRSLVFKAGSLPESVAR